MSFTLALIKPLPIKPFENPLLKYDELNLNYEIRKALMHIPRSKNDKTEAIVFWAS